MGEVSPMSGLDKHHHLDEKYSISRTSSSKGQKRPLLGSHALESLSVRDMLHSEATKIVSAGEESLSPPSGYTHH